MGFYLRFSEHHCNCWLKNVNAPLGQTWQRCTGKNISGSKLVRMVEGVATHTGKLLQEKNTEHWHINFVNFCEIKVCYKMWACFTLISGWLKTSAMTNMRPQNNTYLPLIHNTWQWLKIWVHMKTWNNQNLSRLSKARNFVRCETFPSMSLSWQKNFFKYLLIITRLDNLWTH